MTAGLANSESAARVLVLEADSERAATLCSRLRYLNCEPHSVNDDAEAEALIRADWIAVMLGELPASGPLNGLFVRLAQARRHLPVLYLGDSSGSEQLVSEARPGHSWRLDAPLRRNQLATLIERARRYSRLGRERRGRITGNSAHIREVRSAIEHVADFDTTVLVTGESGTGKELVARTIHDLSPRSDKPFVPINCGAIQPELLESELFGHEKGAFTGAVSARKGRFELAAGGTLFLDEIGDMSMAMQVKLLRVLQENEFTPVGGSRTLKGDCRIIAATHKDLVAAIDAGEFREDLYYRLNVFPICMPPLRKRVSDLPELLEELMLSSEPDGHAALRLTERAAAALALYPWPGNIRELANLVERLAILNPTGQIDLEDLPPKYRLHAGETATAESRPALSEFSAPQAMLGDGVDLRDILMGVEIRLIRQALQQAGGTVAEAARLLQVQRTTLVEKLRKYRLDSDVSSKN